MALEEGKRRKKRPLLPITLDVTNRAVLVVGAGKVGSRRAIRFLEAGAKVRIVSPTRLPSLDPFVLCGRLDWQSRNYTHGDELGMDIVVAATDDETTNAAIARAAAKEGAWVNQASDAEHTPIVMPAVVTSGGVQIAITTSGTRPSYAKALSDALVQDIARGTQTFVNMLRDDTECD